MMILTLWPGVASAEGDTTGPNFESGYPMVGAKQPEGSKQVEIVFKADESGNYFYVILPIPSFKPTAEQIRNHCLFKGLISGVLSSSVDSYVYEKETKFTTNPSINLENGVNYDLYMVLEDNEENLGTVTKIAITTPGSGIPPVIQEGYPKQHEDSHHPGCKRVRMTVAPEEGEVTAYYVAVDHNAEQPSNTQIKAGQDSSGKDAIVAGSQDKVKSNGFIINSKKLPADDTFYDFWFVLEDIDGKLSEPKKITLKTPIKLLTDGYPQVGAVQAAGSKQVEILVKANGSATAYYVAVSKEAEAPADYWIKNGKDAEGNPALAAGSMELEANAQASSIVKLPFDDTDYDIYLVLYENYPGGGFIDNIWSEVVKLDVKTPASAEDDKVCAIGDTQYATLDAALATISAGEAKTIRLLKNIDYNAGILIDGKNITFDLGGFTLDVKNPEENGIGLDVVNEGKVFLTGLGELNVEGYSYGVRVDGTKSEATVTNATATGPEAEAAHACNQASLTVLGDVAATGVSRYGVHVREGADIEVHGNISAEKQGIFVYDATVKVAGRVQADGKDDSGNTIGVGIEVYKGVAEIGGNVDANWIGAMIGGGGSVTIDGMLAAPTYIQFADSDPTTIDEYLEPTSKPGYRTYQRGGIGTVWIKEASVVCAIGEKEYATLSEALEEVKSGETIKLLQDIIHTDPIIVSGKKFNLDLGDYDLLLDTSAEDSFGYALTVEDGGKVNLTGPGTGQFNVKGSYHAIRILGAESAATVHNVEITGGGNGVYMYGSGPALDGGTITVKGDIKAEKGTGIDVNAKNGKVVVKGNITAHRIGVNIASNPNTEVIVNGDITVTNRTPDSEPIGIRAYGNTAVTVKGNLTVRGTNSVAIEAYGATINIDGNVVSYGTGAETTNNGNVTIHGSLSAGTPFIVVGSTEMSAEDVTEKSEGFLVYTDGKSTVRIGSVGKLESTYTVTVTSGSGSGEYAEGDEVVIMADAPELGKEFKEWTGTDGLIFTEGSKDTATAKFTMPDHAVTVTATYKDKVVIPNTYTVTLNGGGTGATGAGNYAKDAIVNIYAGERSGYSFNGWTSPDGVTFVNPGNATTTFTMPAKNITITANWKSTGSSSGGGGGRSQPSVPTIDAIVKAGNYQENYPVTLNKSDNLAIANLSSEDFNTAIEKAKTDSGGLKTVNIIFPSVQDINSYALGLPASAFAGNENNNINMSSELGSLILPSNMLNNTEIEDEKDIEISITKADKSKLSKDVKNQIGDRPIVAFKIKQGERVIAWNNPTTPVQVSIPYRPTEQELLNPEHITVWYIDGNGNVHSVPSGRYNSNTGMVTFNVTHFSSYAVAYVTKTFGDLGSVAWAKKPIEVLTSKGILEGISDTKYDPHTNITRADFLYFLIRTLSVDASFDENFDDINSDAYYYKEIGVAKKLGITSGVGNNHFSPDSKISRQDMITLTERALRMFKDLKAVDERSELDKFTDKSLISDYALNSVATLVNEGLIEGSNNEINPKGNTTRAEAAVFLYKIYNKY